MLWMLFRGQGGVFQPGLPEISWHNIPKWGKMYQMGNKLPNGYNTYLPNSRNIFQMAIEYTTLFYSNALKNVPNLGFWSENIPSGNPAFN
jgi:hypothetical protein